MRRRPPPELEATHEVHHVGGVRLAVHRDWRAHLPLEALLAGAPFEAWGERRSHDLEGRGGIEVIGTPGGELVAKRLTRGGLAGGLAPDLFGDPWRPAREACLAEALRARACPTPVVVVARAVGQGCGLHRLELATERMAGAVDLLDAWLHQGEARALAALAGRTLRRLHDVGLRHRDLQVKNLLVPREGATAPLATVIDLDRSRLAGPLDHGERERSVARFARSMVKRGLLPGFRDAAPESLGWTSTARGFMEGYGTPPGSGRRAFLRRVARRLARDVALHSWTWRSSERA